MTIHLLICTIVLRSCKFSSGTDLSHAKSMPETKIFDSALELHAHTNEVVKVKILEGINASLSLAIRDEGAKVASWEHRSHCVEITARTGGSWERVDSKAIAAVTL